MPLANKHSLVIIGLVMFWYFSMRFRGGLTQLKWSEIGTKLLTGTNNGAMRLHSKLTKEAPIEGPITCQLPQSIEWKKKNPQKIQKSKEALRCGWTRVAGVVTPVAYKCEGQFNAPGLDWSLYCYRGFCGFVVLITSSLYLFAHCIQFSALMALTFYFFFQLRLSPVPFPPLIFSGGLNISK